MKHRRLNRLDLPPSLVRILAREGPRNAKRPIPRRQIARACGVSLRTIDHVSRMASFDRVKVGLARRFCDACVVTDSNLSRHIAYLRRQPAMLKKYEPFFRRFLR